MSRQYWVIRSDSGKLYTAKLFEDKDSAERTAENVRNTGKEVKVESIRA